MAIDAIGVARTDAQSPPWLAEWRPLFRRVQGALARRSRLRRTRIDDAPLALGNDLKRGIVGVLRRGFGYVRLNVGIRFALLLGGIEARIIDWIGVPRPQPRNRLESGRVDWIRCDVVDCRQAIRLDAEIERISNQRDADNQPSDRLANAADSFPPNRYAGGKREQDRDDGKHQGARQRRQSWHDIERARAHNDDGDERCGQRKQRKPPRPDGKP